MTKDQITYFETFGFLLCRQLLAAEEVSNLAQAFDAAMVKARRGEPRPQPGEKRQQIVPFFDYDPGSFYPLLEDDRIVDVFETLLGPDYLFTLSEGIIHTGGTGWHHDACAPEGLFSMRAAIYLDRLGPDEGCLSVIPGSHRLEFREGVETAMAELNLEPGSVPGRYPAVNEPGDVLFMNHKLFHSAIGERPWRRAIHINCVQNASPENNREHFDWLCKFLQGETEGWGRFYSERLIAAAGPRLRKTLDRVIDLGFGNTGPITHLQDQ